MAGEIVAAIKKRDHIFLIKRFIAGFAKIGWNARKVEIDTVAFRDGVRYRSPIPWFLISVEIERCVIETTFSLTDCHSGSIFPFLITYNRGFTAALPCFWSWEANENIDGAIKTCLVTPPSTCSSS